ncbi:MAG TPA: hypothetical protein VLH40_01120 [Atribacteraceae bacterium]|nr:hypothetical protein [Atribacteraceae bacterium]
MIVLKKSTGHLIILGMVSIVLLLTLSGCQIGLGVGFQFRMGFVYFESTGYPVYGPLLLDGHKIGTLEPLGRLRRLTTLDFRHLLELVNPRCPDGLCSWILEPPLVAGEIIYLSLPALNE